MIREVGYEHPDPNLEFQIEYMDWNGSWLTAHAGITGEKAAIAIMHELHLNNPTINHRVVQTIRQVKQIALLNAEAPPGLHNVHSGDLL